MKVKSVKKVYGCTNEGLEEEYYVVGEGAYGCLRIEYNSPRIDGDKHYCDVVRKNSVIRIFEPTTIEFVK